MKKSLIQWTITIIIALMSSACVSLPPPTVKVDVRSITTIASKNMIEVMELGKSTKQDVLDKFGPTRSVSFDSGFEVWAYQIKQENATKISWVHRIEKLGSDKGVLGNLEVVLLFDPAGILRKKRLRNPAIEEADQKN